MLIFIYMNQRVLDQAGDLLQDDCVDKPDHLQADLENLLVALEQELQDDNGDDGDNEVELDNEPKD
jgi:hypothetical protein